LQENFAAVLRDHTAGDPMREGVKWTFLTAAEIGARLAASGTAVSITVVRQLLKEHGYVKRKAQKKQSLKRVPQRNEQFENIGRLKEEYRAVGNPILSIDSKKKEQLGDFYREGRGYCTQPLPVLDHDFNTFATGVAFPHGLYDLQKNGGYVHLGISHDTSEFACDSLYRWWERYGQADYPQATSLLLLCDGGGSNSCRQYLFKQDLQNLADKIGREIRVAHYPPYTSKYNPIEHRLFPHVTRACQGVVLKTLEIFKNLVARTNTATGLRVFVDILDKAYQTGRKATQEMKNNLRIVFDDYLPKWNYRAVPVLALNREVI
jgi:hypothetical protein